MNIIFDGPQVENLKQRHILLELDRFQFVNGQEPVQAWCVIEQVPVAEIHTVEHYKRLHTSLMTHYWQRQWHVCEDAMLLLKGRWNGELDSFYTVLAERIQDLKQQALDSDWSGIIVRAQPQS